MDPERADRVEQLYHSALEHDTGERDAFLRQACCNDPTLEQEVRSLLAAHYEASSFLERVSKIGSASSEVLTSEAVRLLSFSCEEAAEGVNG
jgi:hypothetical protein